jgi:pimeloyl-ACP methyl ester carboxylesterase
MLIQTRTTGGQYDLIGFDQRGTKRTLKFDCFPTPKSEAVAQAWMYDSANSSDVAMGKIWANAGILAEQCSDQMKKRGALIGTAFTARDMMQFVDALGEDGMLRYWGRFSSSLKWR